MHVNIASVTSKGQFTIPQQVRDTLRLTAGSKMVVMCDGKHLLMKPIQPGEATAFKEMVKELAKLEQQAKQRTPKKNKKGGT